MNYIEAGSKSKTNNIDECYIDGEAYFNKYSIRVRRESIAKRDTLIGRVMIIRDKNAIIKVEYNATTRVNLNITATLPIAKVNSTYIVSLSGSSLFLIGDVIACEVIDCVGSEVTVSTVSDDLGVMLTSCSYCKQVIPEFRGLNCPNCNHVNLRKYSSAYSKISYFLEEHKPQE